MDRRHVLAGLAAAAAASPALAQQTLQTQQQTQPMAQAQTNMPAGTMQGGQMGAMGQAEQQYMQKTLQAGTVALETSRVAQQKATDPNVKQFSRFETEEQTTIAEILRSMADPGATASTGQPAIPADKAQMVQQLQQMQGGAEFDRMYVQGQIQGHQELLAIQEQYLQGGRNLHATHIAKLAAGRIREHIEELQGIQQKLRG